MARAAATRRGRSSVEAQAPAATTRRAIAEAALEIIDQEGLEALSVRRLGAELGIHYSSIYHHFRNKRDILGAVSLLVLQDLKLPEPGDEWLGYLVDMNLAYRDVLMAHPNVVPLMLQHPNPRRGAVREAMIELVRADGGVAADVDNLLTVAEVFAVGLVLVHNESSAPKSPTNPANDDEMFLAAIRALLRTTFESSRRATAGGRRRRLRP